MANPNQTESMQQAVTPQAARNVNESIDWSLSESSPGQPAMARPGAELPPRGRFRHSPALSSNRGRARLTMRSLSMSGKRGASRSSTPVRRQPARMESPAAERIEIEKHRVIRPEADTNIVEHRFAALEQQQTIDHAYLEQLAKAVRSLYEAQDWERLRRVEVDDQSVLMDMNLRRELATLREGLQSVHKKIPEVASQELQNFFTVGRGNELVKHGDAVDEKIAKIQQASTTCRAKASAWRTTSRSCTRSDPRKARRWWSSSTRRSRRSGRWSADSSLHAAIRRPW